MRRRIVRRVGIVSLGMHMPSRVLTNADMERIVDTSDEWIVERTGIRERRIAADYEQQSDLAYHACRQALSRVGLTGKDVDQVVVGTVTPDHLFPSSANTLAGKLGIIGPPSFDVFAACSGFLYAIYNGIVAIESGRVNRVLVVGSEVMSSITDWQDRNTCILLGDGAGVVLLEPVAEPFGIVDIIVGSDGRHYDLLHMDAGGSALPASHETVDKRQHSVQMNGPEVFKLAVRHMGEVASTLLERNRLRPQDIGCFIAHQANLRIVESTAKRLGLRPNQVYNNIQRYGNTTSATIPTCLFEAEAEGKIRRGDWVICVTFGAGLTWGGFLMRWGARPLPKVEDVKIPDTTTESYPDRLRPGRDWQQR